MDDDWWNVLFIVCLLVLLEAAAKGAEHNDWLNGHVGSFDLDSHYDYETDTYTANRFDLMLLVGGIAAYAVYLATQWLLAGLGVLCLLRLVWRSYLPKPVIVPSAPEVKEDR